MKRLVPRSGGITVLVIDDDDEFCTILGEVLAEEGCRVARASNGAEALDALRSMTPDLIIVDVAMPVMNGTELVERLTRDERLARIPIAVATAWEPPGELSGRRIVRKPIDLQNLLGVLDAIDAATEP